MFTELRRSLAHHLRFLLPLLRRPPHVPGRSRGRLLELHIRLQWLFAREAWINPSTYNTPGDCYQSFERIGLLRGGRRTRDGNAETTEQRFAAYQLASVVEPGMRALDIGANTCFLSILLAERIREVVALEPTGPLIQVGRLVSEYLGIRNIRFVKAVFEDYVDPEPFDLILSLAAFRTADSRETSPADTYFARIQNLLASDGYLLFESVALDEAMTGTLPHVDALIALIGRRMQVLRKERIDYPSQGKFRWVILARKSQEEPCTSEP